MKRKSQKEGGSRRKLHDSSDEEEDEGPRQKMARRNNHSSDEEEGEAIMDLSQRPDFDPIELVSILYIVVILSMDSFVMVFFLICFWILLFVDRCIILVFI